MNQENNYTDRLARLSAINNPDEFIQLFRSFMAEENNLPENVIFPLKEDGSMDLLYTLFGLWLAMAGDLPLNSKDAVIRAMDKMGAALEQMKQHLSEDEAILKRDILQCLRRGVTPEYWPRVKK